MSTREVWSNGGQGRIGCEVWHRHDPVFLSEMGSPPQIGTPATCDCHAPIARERRPHADHLARGTEASPTEIGSLQAGVSSEVRFPRTGMPALWLLTCQSPRSVARGGWSGDPVPGPRSIPVEGGASLLGVACGLEGRPHLRWCQRKLPHAYAGGIEDRVPDRCRHGRFE